MNIEVIIIIIIFINIIFYFFIIKNIKKDNLLSPSSLNTENKCIEYVKDKKKDMFTYKNLFNNYKYNDYIKNLEEKIKNNINNIRGKKLLKNIKNLLKKI